ncbi:MAG: hypothetical protein ACYC46_15310 [Acidobacteriaceae bacterium]
MSFHTFAKQFFTTALLCSLSAFGLRPIITHALTPEEYWSTYQILRDAGHVEEKTSFPSILLHDLLKADVGL